MNTKEILKKYPWIYKQNQKLIISPDSDGILCALLYINYFGGEVVGYYDGKIMLCDKNIKPDDCIFLDVDIYCKKIKSIGHHMVCYNKNKLPLNWENYENCLQLNNIRGYDKCNDFQRKFPLATIHFLLVLLSNVKKIKLSDEAIIPLLFSDGVWNNLFGYTENCLAWFDWLQINKKDSILHEIFCGDDTFFSVMELMNDFLRDRDLLNSREKFNLDTNETIKKNESRSGDRLIISNKKGEPLNIKSNGNNSYNLTNAEQERFMMIVKLFADLIGWKPKLTKWKTCDLKLYRFSKSNLGSQKKGEKKLNTESYNEIVESGKCFSMAITSTYTIEYTIDENEYFC